MALNSRKFQFKLKLLSSLKLRFANNFFQRIFTRFYFYFPYITHVRRMRKWISIMLRYNITSIKSQNIVPIALYKLSSSFFAPTKLVTLDLFVSHASTCCYLLQSIILRYVYYRMEHVGICWSTVTQTNLFLL